MRGIGILGLRGSRLNYPPCEIGFIDQMIQIQTPQYKLQVVACDSQYPHLSGSQTMMNPFKLHYKVHMANGA